MASTASVPRWTRDGEPARSPSPPRWAPRRSRSPNPSSQEWAPDGSRTSFPESGLSEYGHDLDDDHGDSLELSFTGSPRATKLIPFGSFAAAKQPPPMSDRTDTIGDSVEFSGPLATFPAGSPSPVPRWSPNRGRSPGPNKRAQPQRLLSPSPTRWAPTASRSRSRSPSPSPVQWTPDSSPSNFPPLESCDGNSSSEMTVVGYDPSATKIRFPFGNFGGDPIGLAAVKLEKATPEVLNLAGSSSPVPRWTPADQPSQSPSPKRWAPRRSRSPSPNPTEWTPDASPTRPLFPRANIGEAISEMTLSTVPRGMKGFFPFGSFAASKEEPVELSPSVTMGEESSARVVAVGVYAEEEGHVGSGGVFLTWEDLWVTASGGDGSRRNILCSLTGYARPGEVLAIMGPSGCGKSTLLDTLAGRLGSNVSQRGSILVNGKKQALSFGTSAYVTQDDVLMTTLTVREALYYSAQLQLPDSMSSSQKRQRAEETIREMGLGRAMDTRIGGWAAKGISGGQKRRVSICMEILTRPALLFLDEPTSGLDSAASYHVMSRIVGLTRREGMTVLAAIHQPSSEVFDLFHGLCLLVDGKTAWFGPPAMTSEFFASNGYPCPTLRNPSDHYLRTINKDFDNDIEQGPESKLTTTLEVIEKLVKSYRSSDASRQVEQRIAEIRKRGGAPVKRGSQANIFTQSLVLTRRSFVNMYRDLGYYWLRFAIYVALCLCVGTIYYDIGKDFGSIQARGSMLMFVAAFLTFMAIGGFPSFVEDMKVTGSISLIFGRERLNGHYGVTAFMIGNTISSIPYLLLISVIPGVIAYYLVGLQRGIDHFAYFALVLFMCMMLVEGLMMIVASIVPNFLMGIITGAGIQGVMMLNGGFFRLPGDLPNPVWRYPMYYIAFHKYANQGFYKNEFMGLSFPNNQAGGASTSTITGDEILSNIWEVEMGYSKWIDLAILFGMVILYRMLFLAIIKFKERVMPMVKGLFSMVPNRASHVREIPPETLFS